MSTITDRLEKPMVLCHPTASDDDLKTLASDERVVSRLPPTSANDLKALLDERGSTHGPYDEMCKCIQRTKNLWRAEPGWQNLTDAQRETLDMFALKVGRILTGDANYADHWDDIAGYATRARETNGMI